MPGLAALRAQLLCVGVAIGACGTLGIRTLGFGARLTGAKLRLELVIRRLQLESLAIGLGSRIESTKRQKRRAATRVALEKRRRELDAAAGVGQREFVPLQRSICGRAIADRTSASVVVCSEADLQVEEV